MGERPDRKQVHVQLGGRLGNQMFEYAAGRALATRRGADLTLVTPYYEPDGTPRTELTPFDLDAPVVARWPRDPARYRWKPMRWAAARWRDHRLDCKLPVFQEPHFRVSNRFFAIDDSCYLGGYWQAWQYFETIAGQIRSDFDLGRFASPEIADELAEIDARATVAVHLRRDDYVENPDVYHLCGRDYCDRGRTVTDGADESLRYLVFSDDPTAAEALLADWPDCAFVSGHTPHEDMLMMSRCRHFIIANSTFSWWAAWLGASGGSRVVAPAQWFGPERRGRVDLGDLHLPGWSVL